MAEPRWYVSVDGHQLEGDYALDRAKQLVQENLGKRVLVWSQGMPQWAMPEELPQFKVQIPRVVPEPEPQVIEKKEDIVIPEKASPRASIEQLQQRAGVLKSLLDFRFTSFIGARIIPLLYGLAIVLIALAAAGYFILGGGSMILTGIRFRSIGPVMIGLAIMVATPLVAILYLALVRLWFEVVLSILRIKDDLSTLVQRGQSSEETDQEDEKD